jgi:hypothetical protein
MRRFTWLLALCLIGCTNKAVEEDVAPPLREPVPLGDLVERINANNEQLPSLWARGYFETIIKESPEQQGNFVNGQIIVQHLKPGMLRAKAEKAAIGDLFDFGTDGDVLFIRLPQEDQLFLGTVGNLDPDKTQGLPIRPDLVLQVLGVNLLPTDLTQFPAPTLRYDPDGDLHRVAFVEPATTGQPRLTVTKEVWYAVSSDGPPRPVRVILNDEAGRPVLSATLRNHQPIGDGDDAPLIATRFLLFFPETGGKMRIDLEQLMIQKPARRGPPVPNQRTFNFDPSRYPEQAFSLNREP